MIRFTRSPALTLGECIEAIKPDKTFVLTDSNTSSAPLDLVSASLAGVERICVAAGDEHKDVESLLSVWRALSRGGATRRSLLVNLGGGMVCDLGGFAASSFKRGIRFINIPTTLLAATDASVGGKTGINIDGLKNEAGIFREADEVIVSNAFFDTLPRHEILSGYAEMIKHAMLSSPHDVWRMLDTEPDEEYVGAPEFLDILRGSVEVKRRIVTEDPTERGLRRILNLGHTMAHALETLSMRRGHGISHGYAVAHGLCTDTILSRVVNGFNPDYMYELIRFVRRHYGVFPFSCDDYPELISIMRHDKKNMNADEIAFVLFDSEGKPLDRATATPEQITAAIDIYRDLSGS